MNVRGGSTISSYFGSTQEFSMLNSHCYFLADVVLQIAEPLVLHTQLNGTQLN